MDHSPGKSAAVEIPRRFRLRHPPVFIRHSEDAFCALNNKISQSYLDLPTAPLYNAGCQSGIDFSCGGRLYVAKQA